MKSLLRLSSFRKGDEDAMLSDAKLQTIIWTANIVAAEHFYRDVLGLSLRGRSHGALVFDVGGCDLRVSPVPATRPSEHTVLGFEVPGVDAVIEYLSARSIRMERFAGFPHAENGSLLTPEGAKVAWFRDQDGNLLSIVQYRRKVADNAAVGSAR